MNHFLISPISSTSFFSPFFILLSFFIFPYFSFLFLPPLHDVYHLSSFPLFFILLPPLPLPSSTRPAYPLPPLLPPTYSLLSPTTSLSRAASSRFAPQLPSPSMDLCSSPLPPTRPRPCHVIPRFGRSHARARAAVILAHDVMIAFALAQATADKPLFLYVKLRVAFILAHDAADESKG
jgi:hypothetical protein